MKQKDTSIDDFPGPGGVWSDAEALDHAAPNGTIVIENQADGTAWQKFDDTWFCVGMSPDELTGLDGKHPPYTVLRWGFDTAEGNEL